MTTKYPMTTRILAATRILLMTTKLTVEAASARPSRHQTHHLPPVNSSVLSDILEPKRLPADHRRSCCLSLVHQVVWIQIFSHSKSRGKILFDVHYKCKALILDYGRMTFIRNFVGQQMQQNHIGSKLIGHILVP
jgi:hypothetical protein